MYTINMFNHRLIYDNFINWMIKNSQENITIGESSIILNGLQFSSYGIISCSQPHIENFDFYYWFKPLLASSRIKNLYNKKLQSHGQNIDK